MTKRTIIIILIGILSIVLLLGLLCLIITGRYEIIEESRLIKHSLKYFWFPSLLFSAALSYLFSFEYRKQIEKWRKVLAFFPSLFGMTLVYIFCFHGMLRFINNTLGHQENVVLNSKIIFIEKEDDRSIADIIIVKKTDTIKLTISKKLFKKYTNENKFNETLTKGSLGFYYKK